MKKTGVFTTKEEFDEIKKLAEEARNTPVIAFSSKHALEKGGLAGEAWDIVQKRCHELALEHGLPEIQGYYGLDANGEFVTMD